ncbi:CheR family methyltransferase [Ilumatobacter sp.]|uniref:CheR family methyltransferase n=1 Tax=Ilumatobacter sp. TaxID=1967498 RepID=UPI003B5237D4
MSLTPSEFDFLATMLVRESAIVLEPGKEYLIESRLTGLMRREGLETYAELVGELSSPGAGRLRDLVVDAMTTNETSFFRDTHPWATLRDEIIPSLVEARRSARRLTFWCAASSSGQEPYSLAMLLHEHFADVVAEWTVSIVGTDLSPTVIANASAGRFSQLEVDRGLPAAMLARHFRRDGIEWRISDDIRSMVRFEQGNLADDRCIQRTALVDGVLMRNVMIYFDPAVRARILRGVHARLRSDGFLLLGSGENAVLDDGCFERERRDRTIFFRPARQLSTTAS